MKQLKQQHWTDGVEPRYWTNRNAWRVRVSRKGQQLQWVLKGGKDDPSTTGRAAALAEWFGIVDKLKAQEESDAKKDEGGDFYWNWTPEEQERHDRSVAIHSNYEQSKYASVMSYEEWKEFQEWLSWKADVKAQAKAIANGERVKPTSVKVFSDLTGLFKAHLTKRLNGTIKGMKSSEDLGESRYEQYAYSLEHINASIGNSPINGVGEYLVEEKRYSTILDAYREAALKEMKTKELSGHWFNERMKTIRGLTTYLAENRLLSAVPPNIEKLAEKFQLEAKPKPMPLKVIRAIWDEADDFFRAVMLLALNCGFRQTEIANLEGKHVKTVSGKVCIEKKRGKTGQPLAIPLWASTQLAIKTYGNESGLLLTLGEGGGDVAVDKLANRLKKIKARAIKIEPTVADYTFENFRDTGASFIEGVNAMLTALYLAQADTRNAKFYVGAIEDENGGTKIPMQLDTALDKFEAFLKLPKYDPKPKV